MNSNRFNSDLKEIFFFIFFVLSIHSSGQTNWYVNQSSGSNTNTGTSSAAAFETVTHAINSVSPGDTVFIIGEYKNDSYINNFTFSNDHDPHLWHQENSIKINNLHGNASNFITFKPFDNSTVLKGDGANIFRITNCSYLTIDGFEIQGEVNNIPLSTAEALQFVYINGNTVANPFDPSAAEIQYRDQDCISNCTAGSVVEGEIYSDLSSISVIRPSYTDTRGLYLSNVNNINIINNIIHHTPGGGLRVSDCEDILIEGNEVHNCSRKSYSGTHGLVVTKATSTRTTNDYRINILRNKVYNNYNEIFSWAPTKTIITPHIDEGKGISLQRNETTYLTNGSINVNWENGKILVANNLCYYNGFSGIHSNDGNRIDFINNTCYFNSYTKSITNGPPSGNGGNIGISAQGGSDIRIINNISVIDSDLNKSAISSNLSASDGLVVRDNIIYGTNGAISEDADIVAVQVNTQMVDPLFQDVLNRDFSLQSASPAINFTGVTEAPSNDFFENIRDANPDLGAVEYINPLPIELLFFKAFLNNKNEVELTWATSYEFQNDFFTIEKSHDGNNWTALEKIQGSSFSTQTLSYQFTDKNPKPGFNYYRLRQTDLNRQFSFSLIEIVELKFQNKEDISIFPNPTSKVLNIKGFEDEFTKIKMINTLGMDFSDQLILINHSKEYLQVDVSLLPFGIYFLIIDRVVWKIQVI